MTPRSVFDTTPGGKQLYNLISEYRWQQAAEQLNGWNREGISAALNELRPRQIESLYLGAIANDKVGEKSNIAQVALGSSPELAKAREAVVAKGISMKEFVDYELVHRTRGETIDKYGFGRYWEIRSVDRSLKDSPHLDHLYMEVDNTVYLHEGGFVGTKAENTGRKVAEFTPPGTFGALTGLAARGLGADEKTIQAVQQITDLGGDVLGGVAGISAQRAQYNAVQSTRSGPVAAEVRPQEKAGTKQGVSPAPATRSETNRPQTQRASAGPVMTGGAPPSPAAPRGEVSIELSSARVGNAPSSLTSAPADVGDKAFKARLTRDVENVMRANMRNTIGSGGEAAAQITAGTTTMDLNAIKTNFPQLDTASRQTFASVKAFGVGKPLDDSVIKRYDNELQSLRTSEEPGVPTKLGKAVNLIATHRDAFQASGSWPTGLARDATPEQIAKFINQQGVLAIPADHVKAVQTAVAVNAQNNPEAYGLTKGPGLEKGIERLTARVQSLGLTSGEIAAISKEVHANSAPTTREADLASTPKVRVATESKPDFPKIRVSTDPKMRISTEDSGNHEHSRAESELGDLQPQLRQRQAAATQATSTPSTPAGQGGAKPPPTAPVTGGTSTPSTPAGQGGAKPPPTPPPKPDDVRTAPKQDGPKSAPSPPTVRSTP